MKKLLYILLLLVFVAPHVSASESAASILDKTAARITGARSVKGTFTVEGGHGKINGSIETSGNKFKLTSPAGTTWCDGKRMWTSNKSTKEITLVNPTQNEINESNPFTYINNYKADYNVYYSKRKDARYHLILLNPKSKNSDIKAIEIAVNKKTMLPDRFIIRDRNDKVSTVMVTSLSINKTSSGSIYECPVESMSDYELIDLR